MSDDYPLVDAGLASTMCDIVEAFGRLENALTVMRWRMHRGDTMDVGFALHTAKKHSRELRQCLDQLQYTTDRIYNESEQARALKIVAENAA